MTVGTRAGERKAIEEKRAANNFVEAVFANDVGKLPDQNVAEAVRRLPGLSVANDQGEGRYVIIRGINPDLVNVTLNGMTLPAPEPEGRHRRSWLRSRWPRHRQAARSARRSGLRWTRR